MPIKQINITWISKEMKPDKWYKIKDEEQLKQFMQLIDKRFGFSQFTLTLSTDYKQVRKTMI